MGDASILLPGSRQFLSSGYETSDGEGSVATQVPVQTMPSIAYIDWDDDGPCGSPESNPLLCELMQVMAQQPVVVYMDYIYLAVEFGENQKQHYSAANFGPRTKALFIRGDEDLRHDYGGLTPGLCQTRIVPEDAAPDEAGDLVVCWLRPEATELVKAVTATIRKRMTFREFVYEVIRPLDAESKLVVASSEDREQVEEFDCEGNIYLF
ncbi:hypothetical protein M3Y99_01453700 [Aphelenchoides fujianensis]|nr:hypothetical protein M3Y99_01453700 [Aphelenchoides fujianensis]